MRDLRDIKGSVTDIPTDRPTDGRTDMPGYRDARTHLKTGAPSSSIVAISHHENRKNAKKKKRKKMKNGAHKANDASS